MTEPAEMTRLQASVRRQWIIVVAAALIGLIEAWMLANHGSSTYWKATQMVTVSTVPGGINNTSKSQIFLTAASMPSVLRTAEAKLGLARGALTGKVSSVLVTSDQSTSSISVRADSRAAAVARVEAVTAASVHYVLAPYSRYIALMNSGAQFATNQAAQIEKDVTKLQSLAGTVPSSRLWDYYQVLITAKKNRLDALSRAELARQEGQVVPTSVYVDPVPRVGSHSTSGMKMATVLQGMLLGIIAGVIVALLRERLRGRRKPA